MGHELAHVVALEGGGTKTVALGLELTGRVVAWGRAGSSLSLYVPEEQAVAAVDEALDAVAAGLDPGSVGVVALAMVGCGYSADPSGPLARRFPNARRIAMGEGEAALIGATLGACGAVALSGTGSFGHAVGRNGRVGHAGGHGPLVGDEGSGHQIAVEAIRRAFWALDGRGAPTILGDAVRRHYGIRNLWEVIGRLHGRVKMARYEVASLAPEVVAATEQGDAVAAAVLEAAADSLAQMALAAIRQVRGAGDGWEGAIPLSCTGGVGLGAPGLRAEVYRKVAEQAPEVAPVEPHLPPIGGVAVQALREAGVGVDGEVLARLRETLPAAAGLPRTAPTACS